MHGDSEQHETAKAARIRVFGVDDHPLLRDGIGAIINSQPDMSLVGTASNGHEGIEGFRTHRPDVTLMDLSLPDIGGIEAMIAIWGEFRDARFIVLTTFAGDGDITRALASGARGYLLKSMHPDLMLDAIRQVHAGKRYVAPEIAARVAEHLSDEPLTSRELEVLRHVVEGNLNRNIAKKLFLSEHTIKAHLKNLMNKLGAGDRTEAVAIAARRGIIHL